MDAEGRLAAHGILPTICGRWYSARTERHADGVQHQSRAVAEFWRKDAIARENYERRWQRSVTPGGSTMGHADWRRANADVVRSWKAA
jgi:hypothetical protein